MRGAGGTPGGLGGFFAGAAMVVAGGYLLLARVTVFGGYWDLWGYNAFGLSLLPLLIGIGLLFFDGRSVAGWALTAIGAIIILVGHHRQPADLLPRHLAVRHAGDARPPRRRSRADRAVAPGERSLGRLWLLSGLSGCEDRLSGPAEHTAEEATPGELRRSAFILVLMLIALVVLVLPVLKDLPLGRGTRTGIFAWLLVALALYWMWAGMGYRPLLLCQLLFFSAAAALITAKLLMVAVSIEGLVIMRDMSRLLIQAGRALRRRQPGRDAHRAHLQEVGERLAASAAPAGGPAASQHLPRVPPRRVPLRITQHPRHLEHPILAVDHRHVAGGDAAPGLLRDHQVLVGPGGDLRQVGDHQHLVPLGHLGQRRAHLRADLSADPLIHLVEHQASRSRRAGPAPP